MPHEQSFCEENESEEDGSFFQDVDILQSHGIVCIRISFILLQLYKIEITN